MNAIDIADMVEILVESGASPEKIAAAVRKIADREETKRELKRADARVRKQRQRLRQKQTSVENTEDTSRVTCVTSRDMCDQKENSPHTPLKENKTPPKGGQKVGKADPHPLDEITEAVRLWNETASRGPFPICKSLTKQRRSLIRSRLRDHGIDGWKQNLARLERSGFANGKNDRGWVGNLDWFASERGFTRLMEGVFSAKGETSTTSDANVWPIRVQSWRELQNWHPSWGPKPGEDGCKCPPELLEEKQPEQVEALL